MADAYQLLKEQAPQHLEELKDFLRIKSISTLPENAADVRHAADWVADQLRQAGMSRVEIFPTKRHPIVYAEWLGAPGAPTVLIYGHFDVQPVDPIENWKIATDPFEPIVRDGSLYARGSSDDKGQVFANIKAFAALMTATGGKLPLNVKFLVEGEEEIGSENLDHFIETHKELLAADIAVISDTAIHAPGVPSIVYGLRGLVYMEIEVHGPSRDLHSGQFGGGVHNPLQALAEIVASLHNADGSINVEGFYDTVRPIDAAERAAIAVTDLSETEWHAQTGAPKSWGEPAYTLRERMTARPTLEVHGLMGGFSGEGAKTVLPAWGKAKISCRLVPNQDPYQIEQLIRAQVAKITPPTVRSLVRAINYGYPAMVPLDSAAMAAAVKAYHKGFGVAPIFQREGGSIPVVATFAKLLAIPTLLIGYGLPTDGAHGPDENFSLDCYEKGKATMVALLEALGEMTPAQLRG
jgi:acetylornithine deacetylase/succinyl-diaminopimelate desuccinylase-like protein